MKGTVMRHKKRKIRIRQVVREEKKQDKKVKRVEKMQTGRKDRSWKGSRPG